MNDTKQDAAGASQGHNGRVIVTYGRSLIALVIARSLSDRGIEVIGCDDVGLTVLSFSKHSTDNFVHPSFEDDEEAALDAFEERVRKYAPDDDRPYILMPSFRDARIFARHRDRFEPLIKIAAPALSSIEMIDPKDQFSRFVAEHDLSAPKTVIVKPGGDFADAAQTIGFPVIAKPVDGVGGRGVEKLDDQAALKDYFERAAADTDILVQEALDGEDYCVSIVARDGELAGIVSYHNLRQFPRKSGAGAVRETIDSAPFLETTRKLLKITGWNGVGEIDFRWTGDPDDPPKLIEVNPRYWAGLFQSVESGVDFPWIAYCIAAGIDHGTVGEAETGFKSRTPGAWFLSVAQDIADSDPHMSAAKKAWEDGKSEMGEGHILQASLSMLEAAGQSVASAAALKPLKNEMDRHKDMPSEFSVEDDPAVGLGALFAVSSLLRHGELPPELVFETPEKEESEEPEKAAMPADAPDRRKPKTGKPVIGITKPENGDWLAFTAMRFAIWLAGGRGVKITASAPHDPHSIDGLLFGGGADVFPERYQAEVRKGYRYDVARDDMEASWADAALEHDIPMMGICRGMQMLNVLQGGTLHPDLTAFEDADRYPTSFLRRIFFRKPIRIEAGSWLARASGHTDLHVNSIHTQAVDKLGDALVPTATEPNGLIQGFEHSGKTCVLGLQFHPEFLVHHSFARDIFKSFVEAARRHRERPDAPPDC